MKNLFLIIVSTMILSNVMNGQACVHYAVTGAGCSDSDFYILDLNVPSLTFIGYTGVEGITALDIHPTTGVLYAVNGAGRCGDDEEEDRIAILEKSLLTIDPSTGVATQIGEVDDRTITDISFNSSGVLFGYDVRNEELVTINLSTGATTVVGSLSTNESVGIAFDSGDNLYLVDNSDVYQIDPSDASIISQVENTNDTEDNENVAFFDGNNNLITGEGDETFYFQITDEITGVDSEIGSVGDRITAVNSCAHYDPASAIPTLSQWGIIILSMFMMIVAVVSLRQRKQIFA